MHIPNIQSTSTTTFQAFYTVPKMLFWTRDPVLLCQWHPQSTAQIFELKCSQVNLAWSSAFPELWWDASSRAWAFRQAALLASVASLYLASGGFQNRQAGAEGQTATWERTEVSPPSDTDAVLLAGKDQSFEFTFSEDVREGRLLQSLYFQELMW